MIIENLLAQSRPLPNRRVDAGGKELEVEEAKEAKEVKVKTSRIRFCPGDFSFPLLPSLPPLPEVPLPGDRNP